MKYIIEFDLPEEEEEMRAAIDGLKWKWSVTDLLEWIRAVIKYTDDDEKRVKVMTEVRDAIITKLEEQNLTVD